jgi:hypothetical protein
VSGNGVRARLARFERCRDVENHDLVDAIPVVTLGQPGRVAGVAQPFEVHTLYDLAVAHIKARDDALT